MSKITKEEFGNLPESLKVSFIPEGDGYVLKTEDVSGLKSALEAERKIREDAEKLAKQFEGLNAAEVRKILADQKAAEEDQQKKAGNFDEILKKTKEHYEKEIGDRDARLSKFESDFIETDIDSVMVKALSGAGVISERLEDAKDAMRKRIEATRHDGKTIVKFKDDTGYASEMKPEEFTAKFKEQKPWYFSADGKGGSGDRNGGGSYTGKTVKSSDSAAIAANFEAIGKGEVTVIDG